MSYIEKNLMPDENLIYRTSLHWVVFLSPALWFLVGIGLVVVLFTTADVLLAPSLAMGGMAILIFGTLVGLLALLISLFGTIRALIYYLTSEFGVTTKRVILKQGFISRRAIETLLWKVEGVGVDQSILGRILDYGTITTTGTGGGRTSFAMIRAPMVFRERAYDQIEKQASAQDAGQ